MVARMEDLELKRQAGLLRDKYMDQSKIGLKNNIRRVLRVIDEQDHCNKYKWINLPLNITSQELERMFYYKGQLMFFYFKEINQFCIMPYALEGGLDFYGRFNSVHPVPWAYGTPSQPKKPTDKDFDKYTNQYNLLSQIHRDVVYGVIPEGEVDSKMMENACVLIHDYTKQYNNQTITPRWELNDEILDVMAECIPFCRTSLIAGSGIKGMRVSDSDQAESVLEASQSLYNSSLTGNIWIPITAPIEFQPLTDGQPIKAEEYFIAMQSYNNIRLSTHGLTNGGLYEKKAHMLESENEVNQSPVRLTFEDGLNIRQHACDVINSIWHIGIWCVANEDYQENDMIEETEDEPTNPQGGEGEQDNE